MKRTALIALIALLDLVQRAVDAIRDHQTRKRRADYEQDIQAIHDDPVSYANHKFGGVRNPEAEADDMHGDTPERAGDPKSQRTGDHSD